MRRGEFRCNRRFDARSASDFRCAWRRRLVPIIAAAFPSSASANLPGAPRQRTCPLSRGHLRAGRAATDRTVGPYAAMIGGAVSARGQFPSSLRRPNHVGFSYAGDYVCVEAIDQTIRQHSPGRDPRFRGGLRHRRAVQRCATQSTRCDWIWQNRMRVVYRKSCCRITLQRAVLQQNL